MINLGSIHVLRLHDVHPTESLYLPSRSNVTGRLPVEVHQLRRTNKTFLFHSLTVVSSSYIDGCTNVCTEWIVKPEREIPDLEVHQSSRPQTGILRPLVSALRTRFSTRSHRRSLSPAFTYRIPARAVFGSRATAEHSDPERARATRAWVDHETSRFYVLCSHGDSCCCLVVPRSGLTP